MQSKAVPPENVPVESEQVVAATATAVTAPAQVTVTASAPVQPHGTSPCYSIINRSGHFCNSTNSTLFLL